MNQPVGREAKHAADAAAREAAPWVEKLARLGYAAKGAVYSLVGALAIAAALGMGGQTTGSSGAMATIADSTLGRVFLVILALGLAGYTIWGLVRAIHNPENDGTGHRIFYAITAGIYALLTVEAVRLALGGSGGGGSGGDSADHWSARLMEQPFGQWLLAAVGVAIAIYGVQQLINAWRVDLDDQLALNRMSAQGRRWAVRSGRLGMAARGVVFSIIGYYVVQAGLTADPDDARGIDAVLSAMRDTPWLLGVIGLGFLAYGIYNVIRARYRVIRPA